MKRLFFKLIIPVIAFFAIALNASAQWNGTTIPTVTNSSVGIGTLTPAQRLQIVGGNILLDATNTAAATGNIFLGGVTYNNGTVGNGMRLSYFNGNNNGYIDVRNTPSNTPNNDGLIFRVDNNPNLAGTERMRICNNGKVAIGTANTPASVGSNSTSAYRLYVKGGILTDEILVQTGWADYVFEKNYQLPTLSEVEKHIAEKGHLPNVPSEKEVVENGLNVGKMAATQQEKIEELFLYVIQLNKDVQALRAENESLRQKLNTQKSPSNEK